MTNKKNILQKEIDVARSDIKTDSYAMSIGEWASLYEDNELDIHPEFQRFFRWTITQKSRFIESLLLGIPVPQIFVAQSEEGIWDVVDGLQRLSTLFEFMGILRDENKQILPPLVLESTKYLPSLEGKKWNDTENLNKSFNQSQRLYLKRAKLDVSIILRESEQKAKYELFQRLNTGGSPLTDQEVRNCIIVMLNRDFYMWMRELANYEAFQNCIAISENSLIEQYDMELALRFIIFRTMEEKELSLIRDVGEFLTDYMVKLIEDLKFNKKEEKVIFEKTFDTIYESYGTDAFRRYDESKERHLGGFLLSAYEVIAMGLGYHGGELSDGKPSDLISNIRGIWQDGTFKSWSGSGVRASSRIPKLIPLGRKIFKL